MADSNIHIFYLRPAAGYRTELRSDTLWGLICWGVRLLYGEAELLRFLTSYSEGKPELLISSAFPYKVYGQEKILFFPKPFLPAYEPEDTRDRLENYRLRKAVKKVRWVNLEDFNEILKGTFTEKNIWERIVEEKKASSTDAKKPYYRAPRVESKSFTHNTIDRINLSTLKDGNRPGQLFHSEEIFLVDDFNETKDARNTGLFFLAKGAPSTIERLAAVLRYYRFNGLGGDRSTGKGTFDASNEPFTRLQEPADANTLTTLSLYHPTENELKEYKKNQIPAHFSYLLERRAGHVGFWLTNTRKTPALYFKEGSVFPQINDQQYFGVNTEYKGSNYTYFTYGHAFMVKMKLV